MSSVTSSSSLLCNFHARLCPFYRSPVLYGERPVSLSFIPFPLLLAQCLTHSGCSEMRVNRNTSRTMAQEQRVVRTSGLTLSRTLTPRLSLLSTHPHKNIPNNRFLLGGSGKGRCVHKTLQEMRKYHKVALPSQKLAQTWHGPSLPGGLSRGHQL